MSSLLYAHHFQLLLTLEHTHSGVDDSTRSTSNWIELVEQQTVQLKRQTADIIELEDMNRRLTTELDEKEGAVMIIRIALDQRQTETESLKTSNQNLASQLNQVEIDAANWKREFMKLELQLNEHSALIKQHLEVAESRADGLHQENVKLTAALTDVTEKYIRASQESFRSLESMDVPTIIPAVPETPVTPTNAANITRSAPPPVPVRSSPLATRSSPLSNQSNQPLKEPPIIIDAVPLIGYEVPKSVDVSMILGLSFEAAGKQGSFERGAFKSQLQKDLAHSSGLPLLCFAIKLLSPGSVMVDLTILPDPSSRYSDPIEVAADLEKQARDNESRLMKGVLTRHVTELKVKNSDHEQYKLTSVENQRLRQQVQTLRAEVLRGEAEIQALSAKINELEKEHLRIAKTLQAQIDSSISQLNKFQGSNEVLSTRLTEAENSKRQATEDNAKLVKNVQEQVVEVKAAMQARKEAYEMNENLHRRY